MASITDVGALGTTLPLSNLTSDPGSVSNATNGTLDAISKASTYAETLSKTVGEDAQAYAQSDFENVRKVAAGALKLKDTADKLQGAAASTTSTLGLIGRTSLSGAGAISATVKGVSDANKTLNDVSKGNYGQATVDGIQTVKDATVATSSTKTVLKAANKLLGTGTKAAAEATTEAVVHTTAEVGAEVASKAAGRFIPGVNDVIAVADTAVAGKSIVDAIHGKGSVGKAIGNSVTALGSIAAATNIPIVSQIGAGVSVASSLITGFFVK